MNRYPIGTILQYKRDGMTDIVWEIMDYKSGQFQAVNYINNIYQSTNWFPLSDHLMTHPESYDIEYPKCKTFNSLYEKLRNSD